MFEQILNTCAPQLTAASGNDYAFGVLFLLSAVILFCIFLSVQCDFIPVAK